MRIPVYQSQVGIANGSAGRAAPQVSASDFMSAESSAMPRALGQFADGLQKFGNVMIEAEIKKRNEIMELDLIKEMQGLRAESEAWQDDYQNTRQGREAVDAESDAKKFYEERVGAMRTRWQGNAAAMKYIEQHAGGLAINGVDKMRDYGNLQFGKFKDSVFAGEKATFLNFAADPRNTPEAIQESFQNFAPKLANYYMSKGMDPTSAQVEVESFYRKAMGQNVYNSLANNPQEALRVMNGEPRSVNLPAEISGMVKGAASQFGVPEELLRGLIHAESGGRVDAVSRVGARGPGQLMPATQKELEGKYGIDGSTPEGNVKLSAAYLGEQLNAFKDPRLALMAYNWGPENVKSFVKYGHGLKTKSNPTGAVPRETKEYVNRILGEHDALAREVLSPEQKNRLRKGAELEIKKEAAELKDFLVTQEKDLIAAFRNGESFSALPSKEEYEKAFGKEDGGVRYENLLQERDYGQDLSSIRHLTPAEQAELYQSRRPEVDKAGYKERSARHGLLEKAITEDRKERNADPALYAIHYDKDVQAAYQAMSEQQTPEATQLYIATLRSAYSARGMNTENLLPASHIESITGAFLNTEQGSDAAVIISQQQQLWGEHWPAVFKQLVSTKGNALPAAVYAIGSGMRPSAAALLSNASRTPDFMEKTKTALPADGIKTADDTFNTAFAPFQRTMVLQGGAEQADTLSKAGAMLTRQYQLQGLAPLDAGRKAYEEIAGNRYRVQGSYRIPADRNVQRVQLGANAFLSNLRSSGIEIQPAYAPAYIADGVAESRTMTSYIRQGEWVTNSDETGLVLYYDGFAAQKKDGSPIEMTWEELEKVGEGPLRQLEQVRTGLASDPVTLNMVEGM